MRQSWAGNVEKGGIPKLLPRNTHSQTAFCLIFQKFHGPLREIPIDFLPPRQLSGIAPACVLADLCAIFVERSSEFSGTITMRTLIGKAFLFMFLWPAVASAQDGCRIGLDNVFSVQSYVVAKADLSFTSGMRLKITLLNNGDQSIRMIDGSVIFQDVLGRDILRIGIDPDQRIEAGGTATQSGIYSNTRLLDVAEEDVVITTCVRGLVYSDGEVFKAGD